MEKLKQIIIIIVSLASLAAVGFTAYILIPKPVDMLKTNSDTKPADQPKAPKGSSVNEAFAKKACDVVNDQLAMTIIGPNIIKNDKFPALSLSTYSSTRCEYASSAKKADIILYRYITENEASANKLSAQAQVVVVAADGKSSSVQPRQSIAGVKGKYVLSVAVTNAGKFDSSASKSLLDEALKGL